MIKGSFYPDYYTYAVSGTVITDTTNLIPVTSDSFSNMYYLGWIKPENIPPMFKISSCEMSATTEDEFYTWTNLVPEDTNFNCGYLVKTVRGSSYANYQDYGMITKSGTSWAVMGQTTRDRNWAFPNKLNVMREGIGFVALNMIGWVFDENDEYVSKFNINAQNYYDSQDLLDFFYNNGSLSVTGGSYTLTFSISDFDEDSSVYKNFDNSTYKCRIFIVGYLFNFTRDSSNLPTSCPSFFVTMPCTDGVERVGVGNSIAIDVPKQQLGTNMLGLWHGGFSGTIKKSDLQSLISPYSTGGIPFTYNGTVLARRQDNNAVYWFTPIYNPNDIAKHFALLIRISVTLANPNVGTPLYGYIEDDVYAPYITENNEFTATLITGDLEDDEFKDKLRPWQYDIDQWAENDYTEEDLPPYEPPEPETKDEESGDSIGLQERYYLGASNFITQYAMYDSQVQTFGQLLWTSWFSQGTITDMWKNFILVVNGGQQSDTGSYDVSSVMDFIVSLQIFPFALDAALAQDTTEIKIGMGAYPLQIGSTMRKILTTVIYLDFGSIDIPRPHGDFRDYDNMTISAVLPYCGTCELNPGDVIGRSLTCMYCVDLQTGNCHAMIMTYDDKGHYYPCASLDGQLSANIALSATNESRLKAQRTMDAVNFAKAFTAPVLSVADTANSVSSGNKSYGGAANALTDWAFLPDYITAEKISRGSISCPSISGGNGLSAFMQPEQPYVQMRYGIYSKPDNYPNSEGVPNTTSGILSSFSGFTVCRNVNVDTIHCHADERAAIKAALESGVYL